MMFNYLSPDSKFWLALLGHKTISVACYIEQQQFVVGSKDSVTAILQANITDLKKLDSCGMITIKKDRREGKLVWNVAWEGWQAIPNIRLFCYMIAGMMDARAIKKSEAESMSWNHLFNQSVAHSDMTERAGIKPIGIVEVCIPNAGVKQNKPYIVVNQNQRATASGFKTLESRENYTVTYSREIQQIAQSNNILVIPEIEEEEKENPIYADWKPVPVEEWNSYHLVNWIIDRMIEVYGSSPYNRKVIMESGIKVEGVQGLSRQLPAPTKCPMADYKEYVDWLLGHDKFMVTPSTLTSAKMMQIYLADRVAGKKKQADHHIPEAFNLE